MLELKTIDLNKIAVALPIDRNNEILQMRCIFDINNNLITDENQISFITNRVVTHTKLMNLDRVVECNIMYVRLTINPRNILETIIK